MTLTRFQEKLSVRIAPGQAICQFGKILTPTFLNIHTFMNGIEVQKTGTLKKQVKARVHLGRRRLTTQQSAVPGPVLPHLEKVLEIARNRQSDQSRELRGKLSVLELV